MFRITFKGATSINKWKEGEKKGKKEEEMTNLFLKIIESAQKPKIYN